MSVKSHFYNWENTGTFGVTNGILRYGRAEVRHMKRHDRVCAELHVNI